jgi:hypothetical protein
MRADASFKGIGFRRQYFSPPRVEIDGSRKWRVAISGLFLDDTPAGQNVGRLSRVQLADYTPRAGGH